MVRVSGLIFCALVAALHAVPALSVEPAEGRARLAALLKEAQSIELVSIAAHKSADTGGAKLYGSPILGTAKVEGVDREKVAASFVDSVRCFGFSDKCVFPKCFFPRHVLRITGRWSRTDLVICFECGRAEPYGPGGSEVIAVSGAAEPVFDAILKAQRIPLSRELEARAARR